MLGNLPDCKSLFFFPIFFFLFCTSSSCSYSNLWGAWKGWRFLLQLWHLNSSSAGTRWLVPRSAELAAKIQTMNTSVSWCVQLCASWKRAVNMQGVCLSKANRDGTFSPQVCFGLSHYPLLLSTSKYCIQSSHLLSCFSGGPSWQIQLCFSPRLQQIFVDHSFDRHAAVRRNMAVCLVAHDAAVRSVWTPGLA